MQCGRWAKGPRVYDWAVVEIRPLGEPGKGYWLLARRSIAQPGELLTSYASARPELALEELVRVVGPDGPEECFEEARGSWDWTSMRCGGHGPAHHLGDAGARRICPSQAMEPGAGGCYGPGRAAITAPEVRRLLTRLVWTENQRRISSCPGRGGDGATKPEPGQCITNAACQICDCVLGSVDI